jgi:hypothetical protein
MKIDGLTEEQRATDPEGNWVDNLLDDPESEWETEGGWWTWYVTLAVGVALTAAWWFSRHAWKIM